MYRKLFLITELFLVAVLSSVCNANELNQEDINQITLRAIKMVKANARIHKRDSGPGFIQCGFYRVVSPDINEYCYSNRRTGDPNSYKKTPLNYENLPDINGKTMAMTLKTSVGDVNVEYQFCLYIDIYDPYDPCSDPNQIMNWVIQKVDKVVSMPHVDVSSFYWGDYYVMQWKIKRPANCKAADSFADWLPDNVGIFMKKYAEKDGMVYYVSNPLFPTMYKEMGGTYIGNGEIHSYIPQDSNDPNNIRIHYEKNYHPLNDITKDICIENQCYKHYYFLFSRY